MLDIGMWRIRYNHKLYRKHAIRVPHDSMAKTDKGQTASTLKVYFLKDSEIAAISVG